MAAVPPRHVAVVGSGPGRAGMLTMEAARALQNADVCLHDRMVDPEILGLLPPGAQRVDVGKTFGQPGAAGQQAVNALLVREALQGKRVVRLHAGDPSVFGRLESQLRHLARHDVRYTVFPGVSAASAAAATACAPLTTRAAPHVVFASGQNPDAPALASLLSRGTTSVCLYMASGRAASVAASLIQAGAPPTSPVQPVADAARVDESVLQPSTLRQLASSPPSSVSDRQAVFLVGPAAAVPQQLQELRQQCRLNRADPDADEGPVWDTDKKTEKAS